MKKITVITSIAILLAIGSCKNNDTTTQMPEGGYKERTDSGTSMPGGVEDNPRGAVAVDSVKNGQFNVSGVPDSTIKKIDSSGKK